MAPLGQKIVSVLGLVATFQASLGLARIIDRDVIDHLNILPRAPTTQLDWPCLPDNRKPRKEAKDPGASVGVLPYTAAMIAAANAEHGPVTLPNSTVAARQVNKDHESRSLSKRLGGAITTLYNRAIVKVPTDGAYIIYWQLYVQSPEELIIATSDLSGCTVVVVSSPHVVLMAHVWERRDEDTWLIQPNGPDQRAKDDDFVTAGSNLLDTLLQEVGGNRANGYNGWLPADSTTVHVIAPAENPDYNEQSEQNGYNLNPWYTLKSRQGLIYENAATSLLSMAVRKMGSLDQGEILTYRRRYSNDPLHNTDDRDKIAIVPYIINGHTYVNLMWDDNQLKPIAQIN